MADPAACPALQATDHQMDGGAILAEQDARAAPDHLKRTIAKGAGEVFHAPDIKNLRILLALEGIMLYNNHGCLRSIPGSVLVTRCHKGDALFLSVESWSLYPSIDGQASPVALG